jgi:hypothetical protein
MSDVHYDTWLDVTDILPCMRNHMLYCTVIHSHLLRKVYLAGIDDKHWTLIKDLHENAQSSIKWEGNISTPFVVKQGVRPEAF